MVAGGIWMNAVIGYSMSAIGEQFVLVNNQSFG